MIEGLKPYPRYKDSGVEWLGQVPEHWELKKLKHLTSFQNGLPFKPTDWAGSGVPIIRIQNLNGSDDFNFTQRTDLPAYLVIRPGELLFSWSGNRGTSFGPFVWSRDFNGYLNQHIFKLVGYKLNKRYFYRLLQAVTRHVEEQTHGIIGLVHITQPELGSIVVPIAPNEEQAEIASVIDYLDRRIRRYIRAKQKLIALLNEQKQAIIHQAVTRGLDPNVRFKPSGVEWLGDVPEHWDVVRFGRVIELLTGFPFKSDRFSLRDSDVRLLRGINIAPGRIRWEEVVRWPVDQVEGLGEYELREGDIVLGMDRPIVSTGVRVARVGAADIPALLLQRVARIRPKPTLDAEYALYLLTGRGFAEYLAPIFTGISVPHISPEQIGAFRVAIPQPVEQRKVVEWVKGRTALLDISIEEAHREIALLREYRTRLIADVVTGKLDVRAAAAALPDESEETDDTEPLDDEAETESEAEAEEVSET